MIDPEPRWVYTSRSKLTRAHELVRLHENCALGQWWCLELDTGRVRWEAPHLTPDTIVAVSEGVILATEMRTAGATTTTAGNWAISFETGEVLWADAEGVGLLTFLWMMLRGRTDDLATHIVGVRGGECACENGRILDIHSGRELRRKQNVEAWRRDATPNRLWVMGRAQLPAGDFLTLGGTKETEAPSLAVRRVSRDGDVRWSFDSRDHAGAFSGGFPYFRYHGDHAYMIVTDSPFDSLAPTTRDWSLRVLDLGTGQIVQRIELSPASAEAHRIEVLDTGYLLWSRGGKHLSVHAVAHLVPCISDS